MSLSTRFWLVRHAPVLGYAGRTYPDDTVAADVTDQAAFAWLAAQLPAEATWVTTPITRTRQTVEALRRAGAVPKAAVLEQAAWAEIDFGDLAGQPYAAYESLLTPDAFQQYMTDPAFFTAPNGESFAGVCARVGQALPQMCETFAGRDVVIVAHGGSIRAALAYVLKVNPREALSFSIDTLSLTCLEHTALSDFTAGAPSAFWRVRTVNARA